MESPRSAGWVGGGHAGRSRSGAGTNASMLGCRRGRSQGARMDLPSSSYLSLLAVVSTTYVGFAALLVGLRQAKGSHLTSYDAYFTLTFIQLGFIVTFSGLLPSLI